MSNEKSFLAILLFLTVIISSITIIGQRELLTNNSQFSGRLEYMVIVSGSRSDDPLDLVSFQCSISVDVVNNEAKRLSASDFIVDNLPGIIERNFKQFLENLFIKWFKDIDLFRRVVGIEKTYVSINGLIIEAYVVKTVNGIDYRELNTGLYVGGDKFLDIGLEAGKTAYYYNLSVTSYLFRVSPDTLLSKLSVVYPPTDTVRLVTIVVAAVILALSIKTLVRWEDYSIM